MDSVTRLRQRNLIKRTQKRLDRLMKLLMKVHVSKRSNVENDVFEEFVRRSLANDMVNTGFSAGPFGITPTPTTGGNGTTETDIEMPSMCNDIRGRDRACCNSAVRCFDDVNTLVDELDNAPPNSFALQSACRRVNSELKRDKLCVQQSLSRCGGPDRGVLQRRFDGRINTLYDQFYKHCRPGRATTVATTTSSSSKVWPTFRTETERPKVRPTFRTETETPRPTPTARPFFPTGSPHDHDSHGGHTHSPPAEVSSGSGALIAGMVTGGIIFALILLIVIIFWCKNRRDRNGSNGSMDSSAGIFFQKRPNMFSANRPPGGNNNNNKHPVARQDSDVYAEIDEAMVNPGYKPPVPGSLSLPGYLNPVSDDDSSSSYTAPPTSNPRAGSSPFVTTRGQLSYGPILAANSGHRFTSDQVTPYYSTTLTFPENRNSQPSRMNSTETLLSPRNLPSSGSTDNFRMSDVTDMSDDGLDEYEQPISAGSSLRYATLEGDNLGPPDCVAPAVPTVGSKTSPPTPNKEANSKKTGVKVLPSNPFVSHSTSPRSSTAASVPTASTAATQPVPQPRKKKESTEKANIVENNSKGDSARVSEVSGDAGSPGSKELVKRAEVHGSNRDSHASNASSKSSHHYFVLEPEHNNQNHMDYENSVSSPKLV